ncbi:leader peptidase (prepilin peptidase) / N-methyltransferase [Palleronia marisminoris]|uniref:Type IV leader peptidase family protein n=1 Tax=Palleronia marisminoris TaxID=315423 RepID=A0A1Y5T759_9RHOB|nr:A24 family peptidase [Palleronia marisminoris]SFH20443.1 leader peptidase (prepilin peptidase) / N-methyltransferase [Palleronia marisminoris]SLN56935.1 Type IV leader peptidase family protein [Palleronia marisminoris]
MIVASGLSGLVLLAILVAITVADIRHRRIPDLLNLLLGVAGMATRIVAEGRVPFASVVAGLVAAGLLWAVAATFRHLRGMVGLGMGDVKMIGVAAIWISPWNLPLLLAIACLTALLGVAVAALSGQGPNKHTRIPFGPFLGLGLMLTWGLEVSGGPTLELSGM